MHPQSQSPHARARQIMTFSLLALGLVLFAYFGLNGLKNASNWQVVTGKPRIDTQQNPSPTLDSVASHKNVELPLATHAQAIPAPETSDTHDNEIPKKDEVTSSNEIRYVEVIETKTSSSYSSHSDYSVTNTRTTRR